MKSFSAKGAKASRLRARKYALVREYGLPEDLLGGSYRRTHRRCGKANCRCAAGKGHPMWSVTASHEGKRRVERVPDEWCEEIERAVVESRAYLDAVKEVMAINLELVAETRKSVSTRRRTARSKNSKKTINKLGARADHVDM